MLTYNKEHTGENEAYSHCQKYAHCAICVCVYQHYAYISHLHWNTIIKSGSFI